MSIITHIYPDPTASILRATQLNNAANTLAKSGDLSGAEKSHLEALELKIQATGEDSLQVALTKNALGELYMLMGKVEEAERWLGESLAVREKSPNFDTAVTRENLGQLWEMKGDLLQAREVRSAGGPDAMACGNPTCPGEIFKKSELKRCGTCKSVWYHNAACQRTDWRRHKKYCKSMEA